MKDKQNQDPFYLQLQRDIDRIQKKARLHKGLFYFVRTIQIFFAGTITILSGISDKYNTEILFLGAFTTALTALDSLFQFDTKKTNYSLFLFELRMIRTEFVYKTNIKNQKPDLDALYEKYSKAFNFGRDLLGADSESA